MAWESEGENVEFVGSAVQLPEHRAVDTVDIENGIDTLH